MVDWYKANIAIGEWNYSVYVWNIWESTWNVSIGYDHHGPWWLFDDACSAHAEVFGLVDSSGEYADPVHPIDGSIGFKSSEEQDVAQR